MGSVKLADRFLDVFGASLTLTRHGHAVGDHKLKDKNKREINKQCKRDDGGSC